MGCNKEFSRDRRDFLTLDYSRGFIGDVGYQVREYRSGYLESRLQVLDRHRQQDQYIHAGVLATMADHTAGYAAFSLVDETHRILTIEFKINFLQPAYGHCLTCKSRIIREGGRVLVGESEIFDQRSDDEVLAAKALVTLMSVHRDRTKPVPGFPA